MIGKALSCVFVASNSLKKYNFFTGFPLKTHVYAFAPNFGFWVGISKNSIIYHFFFSIQSLISEELYRTPRMVANSTQTTIQIILMIRSIKTENMQK